MLNKLKNLFKDKNSAAWKEQVQLAKGEITMEQATEIRAAIDEVVHEQYPSTIEEPVPDPAEIFYASVDEMIPTNEEREELTNEVNTALAPVMSEDELRELVVTNLPDNEYLKYSPEPLGYPDTLTQLDMYRMVQMYTGADSVLDYGCGRGDFKMFVLNDTGRDIDYIGLEKSIPLYEAGKFVYQDATDIRLMDWSQPHDFTKEWCINITGLNLRYDFDVNTSDMEFFEKAIDNMMEHCVKGVVVVLASDFYEFDPGIIRYNPGELLNLMRRKYGACLVDHSMNEALFTLVIYKP
jgi:hypothetical protein